MEDSLKRLHRVRQNKTSSANMANQVTGNSSISDDDKIRIQLGLDINEFGSKLEKNFNGYKGGCNFDSLYKIVEDINACFQK